MSSNNDSKYVPLETTPEPRPDFIEEQDEIKARALQYIRKVWKIIEELEHPIHKRDSAGNKVVKMLQIESASCLCMPSENVKRTLDDNDIYVKYERFDTGINLKMSSLPDFINALNYHFDVKKNYYRGCRFNTWIYKVYDEHEVRLTIVKTPAAESD